MPQVSDACNGLHTPHILQELLWDKAQIYQQSK